MARVLTTASRAAEPAPLAPMFGRVLVAVLMVVVIALHAWYTWVNGLFFDDFRVTIWNGAQALLAGTNPYPAPDPGAMVHGTFVYPPLILVVFGPPLGVLPFWAASAVWTTVLVVAVAAALRLLDVHDLRCYAVVFLSFPVWAGITWGQATMLLLPLAAAAWRWRHRGVIPGLAIGAAIAFKPFVWPLLLWLLATRRLHATAGAVGVVVVGNLAAWTLIGLDGLTIYPALLRTFVETLGAHGALTYALAAKLGATSSVAGAAALTSAMPLLVFGAFLARSRDESAEARSYSAFLIAGLLASQIVWAHYFALLFVVAALRSRRLNPYWLLPAVVAVHFIAFQLNPFMITLTTGAPRATWVLVLCILVVIGMATAVLPRRRSAFALGSTQGASVAEPA